MMLGITLMSHLFAENNGTIDNHWRPISPVETMPPSRWGGRVINGLLGKICNKRVQYAPLPCLTLQVIDDTTVCVAFLKNGMGGMGGA